MEYEITIFHYILFVYRTINLYVLAVYTRVLMLWLCGSGVLRSTLNFGYKLLILTIISIA
jgi:hypothetical protein